MTQGCIHPGCKELMHLCHGYSSLKKKKTETRNSQHSTVAVFSALCFSPKACQDKLRGKRYKLPVEQQNALCSHTLCYEAN